MASTQILVVEEQSPSSSSDGLVVTDNYRINGKPWSRSKGAQILKLKSFNAPDIGETAEPRYEQRSGFPINDIMPYDKTS